MNRVCPLTSRGVNCGDRPHDSPLQLPFSAQWAHTHLPCRSVVGGSSKYTSTSGCAATNSMHRCAMSSREAVRGAPRERPHMSLSCTVAAKQDLMAAASWAFTPAKYRRTTASFAAQELTSTSTSRSAACLWALATHQSSASTVVLYTAHAPASLSSRASASSSSSQFTTPSTLPTPAALAARTPTTLSSTATTERAGRASSLRARR
mmetsp:Transcript_12953/g.24679  ORF Transcript_12953/g.24679 Transcript_12953/m.24679 type:complete len:207 (+) Transcript_12953:440-1060(+)